MNATPSATRVAREPPDTPDAPDDTDPFDSPLGDDAELDAELDAAGHPVDDGEVAPLQRPVPSATEASEAALAGWLARIVEHDERALVALYDATLARVYGLVMRIVHRAALADEVVEDAYFQVWRQAVRFDPARGRAMTWLLGMARSRAIDALRREARFQHDSLDADTADTLPDDAPPADALLEAARGHAELQRALLRLNAQPRQLVAMAFFGGLSHEEIASRTALPLGTVKSQIRRALITLRQLLGEAGLGALAS